MGNVGNIWVTLGLKIDEFEKNMTAVDKAMVKVGDKFQDIGKRLTIVGGAITGAMGLIIAKTANLGDEFNDLSQRTGIAVGTLSSFKLAADKSGTSIGGFATGMKGLSRAMYEAATGGKDAKDAFASVGVSATDASGNLRPLDQVMLDVADRFAAMPDGAEKSALAMKLFGKAGMDLIPMLNLGRAGLQENIDKMQKYGAVTAEEARAGDAFNDALADMQAATGGLTRVIGNALIPALTTLAGKVADGIAKVTAWAKEHPWLTKAISGTVFVIGGLVTALGALSFAFGTVLKHLPALITGIKTIGALAAKSIVFTFSLAGVAIVTAGIAKMIADFKRLRAEGDTTAEAIRTVFLNLNPFKSLSQEGLGKFLTDMEKARNHSVNLKGAIALLNDAFKAIKGSIEGGGAAIAGFGEALKSLGIKTKTELTTELREAEAALRAFRGSAEATPGQVKALEDKIKDLKAAMSGAKEETESLAQKLDLTLRSDLESKLSKLTDAWVRYAQAGRLTAAEEQKLADAIAVTKRELDGMGAPLGNLEDALSKVSLPLTKIPYHLLSFEQKLSVLSDAFGYSAETVRLFLYELMRLQLAVAGIQLPDLWGMFVAKGEVAVEKTRSLMQEVSTVISDAMRNIASAIVGAFNIKGLFGAQAITVEFDSSPFDAMVDAATSAYDKIKSEIESNVDALRAATEKEVDIIQAKYDAIADRARDAYSAAERVRSRAEQDADIQRSRQEAAQDRVYRDRYERERKAIQNSKMTGAEKAKALLALEKKYEADTLAREIAREDAKLARDRKREDEQLKRQEAQEKKLEAIRATGRAAEQAARDAAAVKEQEFLTNLLNLQNQHQLDLDAIRAKEDLARQKQADDEEKRQDSLWFKVKGIFATAVEEMATAWLTNFIGKLIPSLDDVGKKIKDVLGKTVENVGSTAGSMAGSFLTAASSIANIVTAIASVITLLKGPPTGAADGMGRVVERQDQQTSLLTIIKDFLWNDQRWGWQTSIKVQEHIAYEKLAKTNEYLKSIAADIKNITGAAGGYSGVVSSPTIFVAGEHGAESVNVTPMKQSNTQPAIYIQPVVIPRGDKYIIEFLTGAMRHGQMRIPAGAVGGN